MPSDEAELDAHDELGRETREDEGDGMNRDGREGVEPLRRLEVEELMKMVESMSRDARRVATYAPL